MIQQPFVVQLFCNQQEIGAVVTTSMSRLVGVETVGGSYLERRPQIQI
jgi:hypothetical protein